MIETVKEAAEYLDNYDKDWYKRINLDILDMGDARFCVIGQAFKLGQGNYSRKMRAIFGDNHSAHIIMSQNTIEWKEEIKMRQQSKTSGLTFLEALAHLLDGKKICCEHWSDKTYYYYEHNGIIQNNCGIYVVALTLYKNSTDWKIWEPKPTFGQLKAGDKFIMASGISYQKSKTANLAVWLADPLKIVEFRNDEIVTKV